MKNSKSKIPSLDYSNIDIQALLTGLGIDARMVRGKFVARCMSGKHPDRDPSWEIVDAAETKKHGFHHCFSCKWGGTAVDLVMHSIGITYPGAKDWIREHAMGKPRPALSVRVELSPLRRTPFRIPPEIIYKPFEAWPKTPREYLVSRGVTPKQVQRWKLGYAVSGRLNGRVFIPTLDGSGNPCNYTARAFIETPKRYLNAEREENPIEGVVYGEQFWPPVGKRRVLVVTEGSFNLWAVERASPVPVGCLSGSHIHLRHTLLISTFDKVVVLTDNDFAGNRADEELRFALARHADTVRIKLMPKLDSNQLRLSALTEVLKKAGLPTYAKSESQIPPLE